MVDLSYRALRECGYAISITWMARVNYIHDTSLHEYKWPGLLVAEKLVTPLGQVRGRGPPWTATRRSRRRWEDSIAGAAKLSGILDYLSQWGQITGSGPQGRLMLY